MICCSRVSLSRGAPTLPTRHQQQQLCIFEFCSGDDQPTIRMGGTGWTNGRRQLLRMSHTHTQLLCPDGITTLRMCFGRRPCTSSSVWHPRPSLPPPLGRRLVGPCPGFCHCFSRTRTHTGGVFGIVEPFWSEQTGHHHINACRRLTSKSYLDVFVSSYRTLTSRLPPEMHGLVVGSVRGTNRPAPSLP